MLSAWSYIQPLLPIIFIIGGMLGVVAYVVASFFSGTLKANGELVKTLRTAHEIERTKNTYLREWVVELQRQLNLQAGEIKRLQPKFIAPAIGANEIDQNTSTSINEMRDNKLLEPAQEEDIQEPIANNSETISKSISRTFGYERFLK